MPFSGKMSEGDELAALGAAYENKVINYIVPPLDTLPLLSPPYPSSHYNSYFSLLSFKYRS
jgi:hypothetical protein